MRLHVICVLALAALPVEAQSSPRSVTIAAADGFELAATYHAASSPGPGVLLLHQCNRQGSSTGYESLAPQLAEAGFHALVLDFRGFGRSTDAPYHSYRSQMAAIDTHLPKDVDRAATFLASQPLVDGERLAVIGASCGGWQAVLLAARRVEVRTVVLLSGAFDELSQARAQMVKLAERPVMVIFSEEDGFGAPASMRSVFASSKHPATRMLTYKGRIHGAALLVHDPELEGVLVRWLRGYL